MRQLAARGVQRGHLRGIAAQREAKRIGRGFAGQVVFRGPQTAHQDDDVGAAQGGADGVDQIPAAIANDGLERDGNADPVQLFRQVKRVGVLPEGSQHLGTDGNDLGFHKGSF